jgi:hypothetical protein
MLELAGIRPFRKSGRGPAAPYPFNAIRRLALPARIGNWSLTSMQRLVKTGGRLMKHARYYWLLLAESHLTHRHSEENHRATGAGGIAAVVRLRTISP